LLLDLFLSFRRSLGDQNLNDCFNRGKGLTGWLESLNKVINGVIDKEEAALFMNVESWLR